MDGKTETKVNKIGKAGAPIEDMAYLGRKDLEVVEIEGEDYTAYGGGGGASS